MKILIFEDDQSDLNNLLDCIEKFFTSFEIEYTVDTCTNANYILENHFIYDLIFLDIEVGNNNGIDIGYEVRRKNHDIRIIFVTSYYKYLIDGYKAQANRYFVKPIQQEDFNLELENVIFDYLDEYKGFIDKSICLEKIYFNRIIYIEYIERKTNLYLLSGEVLCTNYPLKYWIDFLSECGLFAQPYKSILVNLKHISGFNKNEIILNNEEKLPVSRFFKNDFEKKYLECLYRRI